MVAGQRRLRTYAATERSLPACSAGPWCRPPGACSSCPSSGTPSAASRASAPPSRRDIFGRARIRSFAFDVEVLYLAWRLGMRIKELPVDVIFRSGSSYDVRRHLLPFLGDIVAIRRHALAGAYRLTSAPAMPRPERDAR